MALTEFENLLGEFQWLPDRPERLPTLMEVAGYPHYENACSNILAFFFDPNKQHGLGTLFLDALAHIGEIPHREAIGSNVTVDREEITRAGNRIDLLIQSDSHAILIENKIWAPINNPLNDYAAHLDSLEPAGRSKHKFLLTLKRHTKKVGYEFRNITHEDLVQEIRGQLGNYVAGADTRYLTFMLDFLSTLDNLKGGMVMDPEFLEFLKSHGDGVEKLLIRIRSFKQELRNKVKQLAGYIDVGSNPNVTSKFWGEHLWGQDEEGSFHDILAYEIELNSFDSKVVVDTVIKSSGWEFHIFLRSEEDRTGKGKLRELLTHLGILLNDKDWRNRFVLKDRFRYGDDLKLVARVVQRIVPKLAASDGTS